MRSSVHGLISAEALDRDALILVASPVTCLFLTVLKALPLTIKIAGDEIWRRFEATCELLAAEQ